MRERNERRPTWRKPMRLLSVLLAGGLMSLGCTADFAKDSEADVILRIVEILGQPGNDDLAGEGLPLFSDVCCGIINDNIGVTFDLIPKNQNPGQVISTLNDVFLERYEIRFTRADGRNQEGVDVPFGITGALGGVVRVGSETTTSITIVRHQAKLEPPLRNLHGVFVTIPDNPSGTFSFPGAAILTTIAELTVHGRTTTGRVVRARGVIEVTFADFDGEG
jgi:hypothetical protein